MIDNEKEPSKEEKLESLFFQLWRQYPTGVSTFSECAKKCGGSELARGGGLCANCLEKEMAELVGGTFAFRYHAAVQDVRRLRSQMLDKVST